MRPSRPNVSSFLHVLSFLAAFLCMPVSLFAGTAEGIQAFEDGEYETAFEELKPAAEAGDAEAQYYLARLYDHGHGVEQDSGYALELFRRAASAGNPAAQVALGYSYDEGIGVEVNDAKAVQLYRKAAEAGDPIAQRNLGIMYQIGEGIGQDYTRAAQWFRVAAENDDTVAQRKLAIAYYQGRGVNQSYETAAIWFERAATGGDAPAQRMLADMYWHGNGVPKNVAQAAYWMRSGMDPSDPTQQTSLAIILQHDQLQKRDEAYRLFRDAAIKGVRRAQFYLAISLNRGWGVSKNVELANAWLKMLAESADPQTDYASYQAQHLLDQVLPYKTREEIERINELADAIYKDPERYAPTK